MPMLQYCDIVNQAAISKKIIDSGFRLEALTDACFTSKERLDNIDNKVLLGVNNLDLIDNLKS